MSREAYPEPPPRAKPGAHALSPAANRALIAVVALLLLVPCFWQPHIMAGDLSSHIYNAWLAGQIEQGKVQGAGLTLAHPITNVLADWVIEKLLYRVGRSASRTHSGRSRRRDLLLGGFLFRGGRGGAAVLDHRAKSGNDRLRVDLPYGFPEFLSLDGLESLGDGAAVAPRRPWFWLALPCAVLALLAHALPLAWALAALLYVHGLRRVPESLRWGILLGGACLLILVQATLLAYFPRGGLLGDVVRAGWNHGRDGCGPIVAVWRRIPVRNCGNTDRLVRFVPRAVGPRGDP